MVTRSSSSVRSGISYKNILILYSFRNLFVTVSLGSRCARPMDCDKIPLVGVHYTGNSIISLWMHIFQLFLVFEIPS